MKRRINKAVKPMAAAVLMTVLLAPLWAQRVADFNVTKSYDGSGVLITGYTGNVMAVQIPAVIRGMPVKEIGARAFMGLPINSVVIPNTVTLIGGNAFSGCTSITSVTLGNSVTSIGGNAFSGCTNLSSVTFPDSVTSIGGNAFSGCTNLSSVIIGSGVTSIGEYAFSGCTSLASVTIPGSVRKINFGRFVFSGCTRLARDSQAVLKKNGYKGIFNATDLKLPNVILIAVFLIIFLIIVITTPFLVYLYKRLAANNLTAGVNETESLLLLKAKKDDKYIPFIQLLSRRELEVVEAVLAGNVRHKQLSAALNISVSTVKTHLIHIYQTTNVSSIAALLSLFHGYTSKHH